MPRARKSARLWLRPARKDASGQARKALWVILDGGKHFPTGCSASEAELAERRLAEYLAAKYQPHRKRRDIDEIDVADVLSIYADDKPPASPADRKELDQRVKRLALFWGGKMLADVTGKTCREYTTKRGRPGGARRDLEVLRAAINYHAQQGFHRELVKVALPKKGQPRDRWLTRDEAAALLWACWRKREEQTVHRGDRKGDAILTKRRPWRHLARFILIGLYTGTRAGALAAASPVRGKGRSFVDLDAGIFYRLAEGKIATNKRQPPAPLPTRLLAHMRRWASVDAIRADVDGRPAPTHFVEWNGKPVTSVKTGFKAAVARAGLPGSVSPHTLRHTAATWLMQAGVDKWIASGFLGMTVDMLDRVYGHHHPDHLREAASRIGYRHQKPAQSLVVSLAGERERREKTG